MRARELLPKVISSSFPEWGKLPPTVSRLNIHDDIFAAPALTGFSKERHPLAQNGRFRPFCASGHTGDCMIKEA